MSNKKHLLWKTAGISAAAAVTVGTVSHLFDRYLVRLALDRELPKSAEPIKKMMIGSTASDEEAASCMAAAARLQDSGCERIELTAQDGQQIVGHWRPCADARRVLIAMHGWRSSWAADFGAIADFWAQEHCNVLFAEQRGQNESGGEYMGFGMIERSDCLDWANWVNDRVGTDVSVYLVGLSMGASTVLMAADLPFPSNVRGIIADCGFTSAEAIWKHVLENKLHLHYGLHRPSVEALCRQRIHVGAQEHTAPDALRHTSLPVLLIHGSSDQFVPVEMTYENYGACAGPRRMLIVPGAGHAMSYLTDTPAYQRTVREFFRDFDA